MRKICCFAGHSKFYGDEEVRQQVYDKARELVADFGVNEFWVGNYGGFDKSAAAIVRTLKREFFDIELNLVIPYVTKEINTYREQYYNEYDNMLMADIPDKTPKRYQILKCNQYMIDNSKYLIAYVNNSFGGATKTLEYAKKKKHIEIFNFGELYNKTVTQ